MHTLDNLTTRRRVLASRDAAARARDWCGFVLLGALLDHLHAERAAQAARELGIAVLPTFLLTRGALAEFDAHDATEPQAGAEQAWCDRFDALLRRVGEAFALDTADRNDPSVAVEADLGFIRSALTW